MALRAPKDFAKIVNPKSGLSMVEAEILAETASSLGHHGRKVEAVLLALSKAEPDKSEQLLQRASREVWAYFVQRELMGMRNHALIIKEMDIPIHVLNRLGQVGVNS